MNHNHLALIPYIFATSVGLLLGCTEQGEGYKEYSEAAAASEGAHEHDGHEHDHHHDHAHHDHAGPHGGRLVEIGHTHHEDDEKVTFYFAEVMPIDDATLTFHLVSEEEGGEHEMTTCPAQDAEIKAIVNGTDDDVLSAFELTMTALTDEGESGFSTPLPEQLTDKTLTVVVPRIVLGGERLTFNFEVGGDDHGHEHADHDHGDDSHSHEREPDDHHHGEDHDDQDHESQLSP